MSSTEDLSDYQQYFLYEWFEEIEKPCLERKTSKLIAAVVENNVDILKELLDSPKWYNVTDKNGYSLLQIAILRHNKEVFDYMLSIPDFPIKFVNKKNQTALMVALSDWGGCDGHFAYKLIKMGACIDFEHEGNTPLHLALCHCYDAVALLLIRMGVDVNVCNRDGYTPISLAPLCKLEDLPRVCTALLIEGAVPSIGDFERSVLNNYPPILQEFLFLHTVDKYSKINLHVLLHLAKNKSPLFHEILKSSCKIIFDDTPNYFDLCVGTDLFTMETSYLILIIQRCRGFVDKLVRKNSVNPTWFWFDKKTFQIENLGVLIENEFDIIDSLHMLNQHYGKSFSSEEFLYLLSYGLVLREQDLQYVYCQFGYCELFKLFLHMDVERGVEEIPKKDIIAVFVYDVTMTIPRFLRSYKKFSYESINELFHYFVHRGLTRLYYRLKNKGRIPVRDKMPQMPSLLDLARNSFRSYFIDTFKIQTTRKFYTLLEHLPISIGDKKIISYETKIY